MWELGVRHALSKRTIIIARHDVMKTISDLGIYGVILYNTDNLTEINNFKKKIKEVLLNIEKDTERSDSPVFDFIREEELTLTSLEKREVIRKLIALLTELSENLELIKGVQSGIHRIETTKMTNRNFKSDAITHLLITNYVSADDEYFALLQKVRTNLDIANSWLDIGRREVRARILSEEGVKKIIDIINDKEDNLKSLIASTKKILDSVKKDSLTYKEPSVLATDEIKSIIEKT